MTSEPVQQHQAAPDRRERPDEGSGPERPSTQPGQDDERRGFRGAGSEGGLREQEGVLDEDGEDRRLYSGEPVETDDGWVIPEQQSSAGKDNIAGGGEWPDADTPPAQSPPDGAPAR